MAGVGMVKVEKGMDPLDGNNDPEELKAQLANLQAGLVYHMGVYTTYVAFAFSILGGVSEHAFTPGTESAPSECCHSRLI